jgi:hypothetical protein
MSLTVVLTAGQTQRIAAGGYVTIEFTDGRTLIVRGMPPTATPRSVGSTMPAPPNKIVRR